MERNPSFIHAKVGYTSIDGEETGYIRAGFSAGLERAYFFSNWMGIEE